LDSKQTADFGYDELLVFLACDERLVFLAYDELLVFLKEKYWPKKCVGQDRHFLPMHIENECKTKNEYIV